MSTKTDSETTTAPPVGSRAWLDENRSLREALESILESMEQMPQLNEAIVEEIMRGDHTLECEIGGDEANISSWVAIARMALSPNAELSDSRPL
jgi:hypothetical protein